MIKKKCVLFIVLASSAPEEIPICFFFCLFFWPVSSTDNTCQYICVAILSSFTAFFLFFLFFFFN